MLETISKSSKEIEKFLNDFEVKFITISKNLNIEEFFSNNLSFDNLIKKNSRLDEESLNDWIEFLNLKSSFSELENKIIKLYDHNSLSYEKINNVFKALYYNFLLKHAYNVYPELSEFSGDKLRVLREEYKDLDNKTFQLKKPIYTILC